MILDNKTTSLGGNAPMQNFSIDMNEHVFKMLTSNVYTDTVLAVMREWSTNAIDACIDADLPIKYDVNLPTLLNSEFSVRDYGTGLSEEDILGLFSMLGASTKRTSNKFNGTFGIGRMSGLAYADSFNIDSYYNGEKISYLISTDSGIPQTISLGRTNTTEPNGLKLTVVVQQKDQSQFSQKAADLYRFFSDKPNLNVPITYPKIKIDIKGDDWYIEDTPYGDRYNDKLIAVMGNVAYVVPTTDFRGTNVKDIANTSLRLDVPLGEVSITPGRESLSMDDKTVQYLIDRMERVAEEAAENFHKNIALLPTAWERAIKFNSAINSLPYSIRGSVKPRLSKSEAKFFGTNSRSYNPILTLGDLPAHTTALTFQYWANHRVTGKTYAYYENHTISADLRVMIADIRTNVKEAVANYKSTQSGRTNVLVIKFAQWDKDNIPAKTKQAELFIKEMGSPPYVKASDHYTPVVVVKGASKVRTATNFNPVTFYVRSDLSVDSTRGNSLTSYNHKKFYYVETSSLQVTGMDLDKLSAYIRFTGLYREQNPDSKESFKIVGVPKNGMANIKNDPRFEPLEGALQHLVKDVHIVDTTKSQEFFNKFYSWNLNKIEELLNNNLPKTFKDYLTAIHAFEVKYKTRHSSTSTEGILDIFKCKAVAPATTYDTKTLLADYPLAHTLMSNHGVANNMLSRYLLLEEQNKGLPNGI